MTMRTTSLASCLLLASLTALGVVACSGDDDVAPPVDTGDAQVGTDATTGDASTADAGNVDTDAAITSLQFAAAVGDLPFSCDETFALGSANTQAVVRDLRFYVSDVVLIDAAGAEVPFALEADGMWQTDRVALLDFENGAGNCRNGTPETRTVLTGRAPAGDYRGLRFSVGVPQDLNHGDPSVASSPLTLSTMHWTWNAGYIFFRSDFEVVRTTDDADGGMPMGDGGMHHGDGGMDMGDGGMGHGDGGMSHGGDGIFLMHLGSTGCSGEAALGEPVTCTHANRALIQVDDFSPRTQSIVLDLATMLEGSDLSAEDQGGSPGCMAFPTDPECEAPFAKFGLDFATGNPSATTPQQVFRAR